MKSRVGNGIAWSMLVVFVLGCGRADVASQPASSKVAGREMMAPASMLAADEAAGELLPVDQGQGPGMGGDKFDVIVDNPFFATNVEPLSTFSIDVDTASYAKLRGYLLTHQSKPRKDAVRIEELVNYFDYSYAAPQQNDPHPFLTHVALTDCPWAPQHRLARVAIKGMEPERLGDVASNLVFLIDVSGSMGQANKLPLLKQAIQLLAEQMDEKDRLSMVVYAGAAGVVLDGASGSDQKTVLAALQQLEAGGSTNGGAGIEQAYQLAREHFIEGGNNRVILCSDGDFNVGVTGTDQLVQMVEKQAKSNVFLTVLGFGMGNHNDAMMEQISGRGNGNYFFIDTIREARKVLVNDIHATLMTIAKDVKIQIEFNPAHVAAYRLIGYENRVLESADFNNDQKDAGEIGAGHCVTALYELVPQGVELPAEVSNVDPLRYQQTTPVDSEGVASDEWMVIRLRYKLPSEDASRKIEFVVRDEGTKFSEADADLRFAAAVASFGMLLRESPYRGDTSYEEVLRIAESSIGDDPFGLRTEFCDLVRAARLVN